MKRVAILSDTHGLLRDEVKSILSGVDAIIHAGDINTPTIVKELEAFAPLYIVRGNNDKEWAEALPESLSFSIEGINIYVVHNKKDIPQDIEDTDTDIVVFGHSHQYSEEKKNGVVYINPGSCGKRRFNLEISMSMMTIANRTVKFEKILLANR